MRVATPVIAPTMLDAPSLHWTLQSVSGTPIRSSASLTLLNIVSDLIFSTS